MLLTWCPHYVATERMCAYSQEAFGCDLDIDNATTLLPAVTFKTQYARILPFNIIIELTLGYLQ